MDSITHTLMGAGMANAFFKDRVGAPAVPILIAASNMPDIDAIVLATGNRTAVTMRRTFGHSIFFLPIWVIVLSYMLKKFYPRIPWRTLLGLSLLGIVVHLCFDLVNSFGVVLLWPWSHWRPELAILFIIDLVIWGLLIAPLLLSLIPAFKPYLSRMSKIACAGILVYVVFCGINRALAARQLVRSQNPKPEDFTYVFPEALGPHRWRGIIRQGNIYRVYLIHSLTGNVETRGEIQTENGNPNVEQVRTTATAQRLEWFFKAPVWKEESAGPPAIVSVWDMRFDSLVIDRGSHHFNYRFLVQPDGRVTLL